ncbi:hypothetical protein GH714_030492 [Hevea brasiliensis]|uniref:Uncharacterized protein n=1 Tax=Hevea brasiliensis TaxID=3981 RepID=A0A6A6N867_HEVBR|nr:hypothetical protein GH714_030492 [Hevea brasiliensis]
MKKAGGQGPILKPTVRDQANSSVIRGDFIGHNWTVERIGLGLGLLKANVEDRVKLPRSGIANHRSGIKGDFAFGQFGTIELVEPSYSDKFTKQEEPTEFGSAKSQEEIALTITGEGRINYKEDWIMDSGSSNHMTSDKEKLLGMSEYNRRQMVVITNNSRLSITQVGKTVIVPRYSPWLVQLQNVYHVEGMNKNLLSACQLTSSGNYVVFRPNNVKTKKSEIADLWHARLRHMSYHKLNLMMKSMIIGLPQLNIQEDVICVGCQYGKAHQLPFGDSEYRAKEPLELVFSNIFILVKQPSISGYLYMITFINNFSRYVWVYFMKDKSKALCKFKEFKETIEKELD